ncbi:MAG: hypothetical protein LBV54_08795 [Puniceicoccales bacterium]|nr:hypothetical protein [Puniceicoccales bacterium]
MKRFILSFFAAITLVFASGCPSQLEKDTQALQGTWKADSREKPLLFTFAGNQVTVTDGDAVDTTTYTLLAETPSRIVMKVPQRFATVGDAQGIYSIEGDALKLCLSHQSFPAEFKDDEAREIQLIVLQRVKP